MKYQALFDYFHENHGVTLLESDMQEIVNIVKAMDDGIPNSELGAVMVRSEQLKCRHDWHTFFNKGYRKCNKCGEEYTIK